MDASDPRPRCHPSRCRARSARARRVGCRRRELRRPSGAGLTRRGHRPDLRRPSRSDREGHGRCAGRTLGGRPWRLHRQAAPRRRTRAGPIPPFIENGAVPQRHASADCANSGRATAMLMYGRGDWSVRRPAAHPDVGRAVLVQFANASKKMGKVPTRPTSTRIPVAIRTPAPSRPRRSSG